MRIDAHHHVWDLAVREHAWLEDPAMAPLRRTFSAAELAGEAATAGIDRSVVVQTVPDPAETPELLELAATQDVVTAVVGWVDLDSPHALSDLDRLLAHPAADALVGIRDLAQDKDDDAWLARGDVIDHIRGIGRRGL